VPSHSLGGVPPGEERSSAVVQPTTSPLAIASVVLLVLGLTLLALRAVARRFD
jgi:hypothetical protein